MGTLADARTHGVRYKIHAYIDPLWKKGYITRTDVYEWLKEITETKGDFHVANLNYGEAIKVMDILLTQKDYNLEFIRTYGGSYSA